jgi:hypothetical protein
MSPTVKQKAQQKANANAVAIHQYMNANNMLNPHFQALKANNCSANVVALLKNNKFPNYEELFMQAHINAGDPGRSVLSPAAYFVDLMRTCEMHLKGYPAHNFDLKTRRPDLKEIPLDGDHTYTEIPYLDIANDIMIWHIYSLLCYTSSYQKKYRDSYQEYVFSKMSEISDFSTLPFHLPLEKIREYSKLLKTSMFTLYNTFNPDKAKDLDETGTWLTLNLSPKELAILTRPITLRELFPYRKLDKLKKVDDLLNATPLDNAELHQILYQNLSEEELKNRIANGFFVNLAPPPANEKNYLQIVTDKSDKDNPFQKLIGLSAERLVQLDRFIRLANKLEWNFIDLDWVLRSINAKTIDNDVLVKLIKIKEIQSSCNQPLDKLCSFWFQMKTIGMGNDKNMPMDLFDRVFNKNLDGSGKNVYRPVNSINPLFKGPLLNIVTQNNKSKAILLSSLKINEADFGLIIKHVFGILTSIKNFKNFITGLKVNKQFQKDVFQQINDMYKNLQTMGINPITLKDFLLQSVLRPLTNYNPDENHDILCQNILNEIFKNENTYSLSFESLKKLTDTMDVDQTDIEKIKTSFYQNKDNAQITVSFLIELLNMIKVCIARQLIKLYYKIITSKDVEFPPPDMFVMFSLFNYSKKEISDLVNKLIPGNTIKVVDADSFMGCITNIVPPDAMSSVLDNDLNQKLNDGMFNKQDIIKLVFNTIKSLYRQEVALSFSNTFSQPQDFELSISKMTEIYRNSEIPRILNLSVQDFFTFLDILKINKIDNVDYFNKLLIWNTWLKKQSFDFNDVCYWLKNKSLKSMIPFLDANAIKELANKYYNDIFSSEATVENISKYFEIPLDQALLLQTQLKNIGIIGTKNLFIMNKEVTDNHSIKVVKNIVYNILAKNLNLTGEMSDYLFKVMYIAGKDISVEFIKNYYKETPESVIAEYNKLLKTKFPMDKFINIIIKFKEFLNKGYSVHKEQLYNELSIYFNVSSEFIDVLPWNDFLLPLMGNLRKLAFNLHDNNNDNDAVPPEIITAFRKISKFILLVNKLKLDVKEFKAIMHHPDVFTIDNIFTLSLEDLNNLVDYKYITKIYKESESYTWLHFLTDKNLKEEDLLIYLNKLTQWDTGQINYLKTKIGNVNIQTIPGLYFYHKIFTLGHKLGVNMETLLDFKDKICSTDYHTLKEVAETCKHIAFAKYEKEEWEKVDKAICKNLNERKRDVLQKHILRHPKINELHIYTPQDLYEYLLIDPLMGGDCITSPIKNAISSIQLYLHRCRLHLEQGIELDVDFEKWWVWLKTYRTWELNRKVFLYPENYIEPELRKFKSPDFKKLQDNLLQTDITEESVQRAFKSYLDSFAEKANLDIAGSYLHNDKETNEQTLYLFGKTNVKPVRYYYRKYLYKSARWTPWKKIDVNIKAERVFPVFAFNKLFIFWIEDQKLDHIDGETSTASDMKVKESETISLFYSFYNFNNYWEQPQKVVELDSSKKQVKQSEPIIHNPGGQRSIEIVDPGIAEIKDLNEIYPVFIPGVNGKEDLIQFYLPTTEKVEKSKIDTITSDLIRSYRLPMINPIFQNLINGIINHFRLKSYVKSAVSLDYSQSSGYESCKQQATNRIMQAFTDGLNIDSSKLVGFVDTIYHSELRSIIIKQVRYVEPGRQFDANYDLVSTGVAAAIASNAVRGVINENTRIINNKIKYLNMYLGEYLKKYKSKFSIRDNLTINTTENERIFLCLDGFGIVSPSDTYDMSIFETYPLLQKFKFTLKNFKIDAQKEFSILPVTNKPDWFILRYNMDAYLFTPVENNPGSLSDTLSQSNGYIDYYKNKFKSLMVQNRKYKVTRLCSNSVQTLSKILFAKGIDGFLNIPTQKTSENSFAIFKPNEKALPKEDWPTDTLDFKGADGLYYREIFFHTPFFIANQLNLKQNFEKAQKWYNYIFNPAITPSKWFVDPKTDHPNDRYWRYLGLRSQYIIPKSWAANLMTKEQINEYHDDPFSPHAIARLRPSAYQRTIIMKYIDNLLDWGDLLFAKNSIEARTEATMIYIFAYDMLGKRPKSLAAGKPEKGLSISEFSRSSDGKHTEALTHLRNTNPVIPHINIHNPNSEIISDYFHLTENPYFIKYWDRVEDRLYKIRHSLDIKGVQRHLSLFQPPLSAADLLRLSSGDTGGGLQSDVSIPFYRFNYILEKAKSLTSYVIQIGGALLSALEKKDVEEVTRLRNSHEKQLLEMQRKTKLAQIDEATESRKALDAGLVSTQTRLNHYKKLLDKGLSSYEESQIEYMVLSQVFTTAGQLTQILAGAAHALPNVGAPTAITYGGVQLGSSLDAVASSVHALAGLFSFNASMSNLLGGYQRREQDWQLQHDIANSDIPQIQSQIDAAKIREKITVYEQELLEKNISQNYDVEEFYKTKFTNEELYQWMTGKLAGLYFQAYQLAYNLALSAQKAFQFETCDNRSFIQPNYWDNLQKGLLAGEGLMLDLENMDKTYISLSARPLEIKKTISLLQLNPSALLDLKKNGECEFDFDEKLFDLDFCNHYCRRIKTLSISFPALVGPYQSINATLTQTYNKVLISPDKAGVSWLLTGEGQQPAQDIVRQDWRQNQQIGLSQGINDNGMFELNFRDDRYLPFEGTGAISGWKLSMPRATNRIDFNTINDVIINLSYTALSDGTIGKTVKDKLKSLTGYGLTSFVNEYSSEWHKMLNPPENENSKLKFNPFQKFSQLNLDTCNIKKIVIQIVADENDDSIGKLTLKIGNDNIPLTNNDSVTYRTQKSFTKLLMNINWQISFDRKVDSNVLKNIIMIVTYDGKIKW